MEVEKEVEEFEYKGLRIKKDQFIAIALNEGGVKGFSYLKNGQPGKREIYYVKSIGNGAVSGGPMLLGQFVFEFEGCPEDALKMRPGSTNRVYFGRDEIQDTRVDSYDNLTEEEKEETKYRLSALAEKYPEHINRISELMSMI